MTKFKNISIADFKVNPFELKHKWMLITAEREGQVNTMTASWGGLGVMWNKDVAFIVIRPQRYTKEFVDASDTLTLSFFDDSYKKDLAYLGKVSGRDEDKLSHIPLNLEYLDNAPFFKEAETVIIAKKQYVQHMQADCFLNKDIIDKWYPESDFHYLYIAEITKILIK